MGLSWTGPTCNFRPNAETAMVTRERKDGTEYRLLLKFGDQCGRPAMITRRGSQGETQHRCTQHLGEHRN